VIDNATAPNVIDLTEYIAAHETSLSTQPSELTVEQSQTIESYAESIEASQSLSPLYAGTDVDALLLKEDKDLYLACIYDDGSFYLGKSQFGTSGNYPTTGFVTQDTQFSQVEPWLAHWKGATRSAGQVEQNNNANINGALADYNDFDVAYMLVVTYSGSATQGVLKATNTVVAQTGATEVNGPGLYELKQAAGQDIHTANRFATLATRPAGSEIYILLGKNIGEQFSA